MNLRFRMVPADAPEADAAADEEDGAHHLPLQLLGGALGGNSIDFQNLGQKFGSKLGPILGPLFLAQSIALGTNNLFNLTLRSKLWPKLGPTKSLLNCHPEIRRKDQVVFTKGRIPHFASDAPLGRRKASEDVELMAPPQIEKQPNADTAFGALRVNKKTKQRQN